MVVCFSIRFQAFPFTRIVGEQLCVGRGLGLGRLLDALEWKGVDLPCEAHDFLAVFLLKLRYLALKLALVLHHFLLGRKSPFPGAARPFTELDEPPHR